MMEKALTERISEVLPGMPLVATVLPQCEAISLYLLNEESLRRDLSEKQARFMMAEPLFWMFCWASGQAMARLLLEHPEWVAGKRVLDFGCGSGVAAIAAAKAGAAQVWASDIDPLAIQATRVNCRLNAVSVEAIGDGSALTEPLDLILAADVLYERANLAYLDRFLQRAPEVLVADSRVKDFDHPPYRKIGETQSFTIPDLAESPTFGQVNLYHAMA